MSNVLEGIWKEAAVPYSQGLAQQLPGETEENGETYQSGQLVFGPRSKAGILRTESRSANHLVSITHDR
jgi:hypothetical protein